MNIPDAAIDAAAKSISTRTAWVTLGVNAKAEWVARAAIEAAMPAIREAIAQEIDELDLHYTVWERATVELDAVLRIVRGTE